MCGIAGVVGGPAPDPDVLARMAEAMIHRGPDSQGIWHDSVAGLAVRRLAIIDLDARSNQPLHFNGWHLAFNGELYNYRELRDELTKHGHSFATEGDGEVLLHAWAEWEDAALHRFNGMFAFAVWHDVRQELVCASDPFGEKPLFWAQDGERLTFASDVRALLRARPDLGGPMMGALAQYVSIGLMPSVDLSFFAGIQRLPGAHSLRFHEGRATVARYWLPCLTDVPAQYSEAVDGLRALLTDSIRLRLRADVPIGTSLSGGVDSSVVVLLAGHIAGDHRRHAFTARFPGFERDEWRFANAVARAAGVSEHHAVEPTSGDLLADLDALIRFQEEPFGSTSIYAQWCVMRAAREAGVTVLLDGQGADELFAGYPGSNGWVFRSNGLSGVLRGFASPRDRADVLRALPSGRLRVLAQRWYRRRNMSPYAVRDVNESSLRVAPPPEVMADGLVSPLARELLRQSFHTKLPELLRYADRNSMSHSREVRLPYLDRRIVDYALSLPPNFLYRDGVTKPVLRDTVRDLAPQEVMARRDKVAFETPQARWLREPAWRERILEVLLDSKARTRGIYASDAIEADGRAGRWRDTDGIWRALNLELWLRAFEQSERDV